LSTHHIPNWKLPEGVSRATWDYLQSEHIASEYDSYFADSLLMQLDLQVLLARLPKPTATEPITVADLGCGTGRVAQALLPRGYQLVNVDLSPAMLRETASKIKPEHQPFSRCVNANLVDVGSALTSQSIDWCVCLFSSLGMIRGSKHRHKFLTGVRQVLKADGTFFVHVHNRYQSLRDPGGPSWLLRSWLASCFHRGSEFGDRVYSYRRLPNMFLHIFSRRELLRDLRAAGFARIELLPITPRGDALLTHPRWLPSLRAGGYFALAQIND
jgi:SAM-dependent methyltransferase